MRLELRRNGEALRADWRALVAAAGAGEPVTPAAEFVSRGDAAGHYGFYYHFLDFETGRRTWGSELSTIDTAILLAGTARRAILGPVESWAAWTSTYEWRELYGISYLHGGPLFVHQMVGFRAVRAYSPVRFLCTGEQRFQPA